MTENTQNPCQHPLVAGFFCSGGTFFKVFGLFLIDKSALYPIKKCASSSHFLLPLLMRIPSLKRHRAWGGWLPMRLAGQSACGLGHFFHGQVQPGVGVEGQAYAHGQVLQAGGKPHFG